MNKIFKVIWSKSKQCYIVVSEMAKNKTGKKKIIVAGIFATLALTSNVVTVHGAMPDGSRTDMLGVAIGTGSASNSNQSVAIGYASSAQAPTSNPENPATAVGPGANANGAGAVALGLSSNATGTNAIALGGGSNGGTNKTEATAKYATAIGFNAKATNSGAAAIGSGANASGSDSISFGTATVANSEKAIAIGADSKGTAIGATALGRSSEASGSSATALGSLAVANSTNATAVGIQSKASQENAVALGSSATAAALNSIAMGKSATITAPATGTLGGQDSIAMGTRSAAKQHSSVSIGLEASSDGVRSVAIGPKASAKDEDSIAIGTGGFGADKNNQAAGNNGGSVTQALNGISGVQLYYGAKSTGKQSIAIGYIANAKESGIAFGNYAVSDGGGGTAMGKSVISRNGGIVVGQSSNAIGQNSVAYGNIVNATDVNSVALGNRSTASNQNAVAVGYNNNATGKESVAIGNGNQGSNEGAVSIGASNSVTANNAVAIGRGSNASGLLSTAIGNGATSKGVYDVAIGSDVTANGNNSVAIGRNAKTSNASSLAIGVFGNKGTSATGDYSIAMGRDVTASAESAVAIGKDAVADKKNAVAFGSGSTTSSSATAQSSTTIGGKTYSWSKGVLSGADLSGMQVSVGNTGFERQIKNVAAGEISANSTDAINGAQLYSVASGLVKDLKVPYVSIKSGATGAGSNVNNDGATGANSIAIGPSSAVTNQNGIAFGNNAQSLSDDSIVIGRNAKAESGPGFTTTSRAIAIGTNSKVATNVTQGIAIGSGTLSDEGAVVTGDQSIAIGGNVKVDGHAAIAIGGDDARKAGSMPVTYTNTNNAEVTGTLQSAISNLTGYNLSKYQGTTAGHAGVAYGTSALAGNAGVAIGTASDSMTRKDDKGQVVDNKPVTNAVAIGTGARANFDNSVAIGGGSNTDHYATKQVNAIIDGVEVKWAGGDNIAPGDVVSFGAKGFERQLKNVAPGEVSQTSTDAVNGSQIYSLARKVTNIMNGGAGSVVNVNASGEPLSKVVTGTGTSKVAKYYRTVDVKDDGSLKPGAVAQTPTSLSLVNIDQTDVNQQTQVPRTLGNVANGVKDNDAVNVSQLNAAKIKYFSVNSTDAGNKNNDGAMGSDAMAIGPSATANAKNAIALGKGASTAGQGALAFGVNSQANGESALAMGFGAQANSGYAVSLGYQANNSATNNANGVSIGWAAGMQSNGSSNVGIGTGAGRQISGNNNVSIGNGAGNIATNSMYTSDSIMLGTQARAINGTASKAVSSVIAIGKGASGGADSAIALGQGASSTNQNAIAIGTNSQAIAYNGVAIGSYSVANTVGGINGFNPNTSRTDTYSGLAGRALTSTTGAVAIGSDSQSRQLTGLAAGTADTDAVNVAQLKSVNLAFKGNTGTGDVNLAAHPLTIQGNDDYITTSATGNTINVSGKVQNITVTNGTATAANKGMADAQNVANAINNAIQSNAYKWRLTANGEATPEIISKDDTVDFSGDTNISVARNGKKITTSLKKDITVDTVKANKSVTIGSGSNQITLDGNSGAVTGRTFSGNSFAAGNNVLNNTTLQIGSPTGANNVSITTDGLTAKAGAKTVKFGTNGIDAGGQQITNVSSGGNVGTNAANITDVQNAVSSVSLNLDTNSKTGSVNLKSDTLKITGVNGIRTDLIGTGNRNLVIGLDQATVNATTKGIGLTGDTGSTGLKYLKDGDATFKVYGDGNLVTTKASATGVQVAVDTAKVKDLAVNAVTVSKANTADNPITVTPTAGTNSKDYAIGIDTTKLAAKTNLAYTANGATAKTVSLSKGLNFVDGTNTVSSVDSDGKVSFDLNKATQTSITNSATAVGRTITLNADSGTGSSQSLSTGNVSFAVSGATGDYISTQMDGSAVKVSTKRATINSNASTGEASVTGNDGLTTAKNVADAINNTNTVLGNKITKNTQDITTNTTNIAHTIALADDKGASTTAKSLKDGNVSFNIKGDNKFISTAASGNDVTLTVNEQAIKDTAKAASSFKVKANTHAEEEVKGGDTIAFNNGDNIEISQTGKTFTIGTAKNITVDSVTAGNTVINTNGLTNGTTAITGTGITTDKVTVGGLSIDKIDGINAGGKVITNVASGGTTDTNAANIGDVKQAVANLSQNLNITDGTNNGTVDLKNQKLNVAGANGVTATVNNQTITVGLDANTVNATTKGIGLTGDTGTTGNKYLKDGDVSFAVTGDGSLVSTTATAAGVKVAVNAASITAGTDGTITGPTTDGVATAKNVADAINAAKKASKTEITANTGEAANATKGNVTLTSTTAADGHIIYDVKLNDKVTLGSGANAVTIDGTAGKATIGSSIIDGVNNTFTTGGTSPVTLNGATGTITGTTANIGGVTVNGTNNHITGLANTTWNGTATTGRAATEDQLKAVADAAGSQTWEITADKDATTSGVQTGTKKNAKVGKDDKVQLIAGENLTVNQNERDFTFTLNKDLVKMNSATFLGTGTNTTVITGDSITQTAGTQTNTSTAGGNTVADGTKSTKTTADGQVIKDGAKSNKSTVDSNVINDGNGNVNTSNATSNTITDGTNISAITAGKATIGSSVVDGVNNTFTTGGANAVKLDGTAGTIKTGTVTVTGGTTNDITGLSNTTVTAADFATKGRAATEEQLKAATGATTLKFTGDVATNTGSVNLKDDTFGIKGDGKYISTDVNGKNVNLTVSEAEVKKSAVAAVTVSTDTTDANNPLTVTPTTSADGTTKDYKVTIDGTKIANKTNLSYKANNGTAKQVSLADGLDFTNGTLTTASIDNKGVVKYDVNTAAITAGADGTITGPTTDGVATAKNVADAINAAKKASKTEITANTGEAANATKGNVTLTSTTAADGHIIYDVKLNDKVTLGSGANAVTIDGTAGKATIGSSIIDGVNNTFTTGGTSPVTLNGATGTITGTTANIGGVTVNGTTNDITGLSNTTVTGADFATKGRAATEEQLKAVGEQTWQITADKDAATSGAQTGTKKNAKVGKDDKVQLIAGENLTVNQNERDFTYSLNKDLVKMNSATFEATGGKTTVIKGDSIVQTDGTKVNTSNATSNTITDGTNTSTITAGKATIGTVGIDGIASKITTGGANAVVINGADGTVKTGTVTVTGGTTNDITGLSNTTVTGADFATKGRAATEEQLKAATGATTLKFVGDVATNTGSVNLKDDTFGIKGDGKYISTDVNGKNVNLTVSEAEVKKSAVAAVTVSTDTTDANNPLTVTPTTSADGTTKDYKVTIDGTKIANKTNLSYKANNGTAKQVSLADGLDFTNGTLTTASIDNKGVVKYDVNTAAITAGADGTITGPTTDGVATAKNVADAINAAKKASKTEITANTGEAANATKGNVTLTSTTAADGHIIYDVKLNDKVTLGSGANAVTIDGTAGKATIGSSIIDGVNNTFTTGGTSPVTLNGATGTITGTTANIGGVTVNGTNNHITGLANTTWNGTATTGRAATEDQLKAVADAAGSQTWEITADKDATTSGVQTGTKKDAKVGKDDKVQLIAGENLTVNQNERDFTYSLNKDLVKMNSATFEATGGKTTVIKGDSIVQTDGTKVNTSNATSNTITDGTNTSTITAGKATIGTVGIDGIASKITTGGANAVVINGADGTVKTGTVTVTGGTTNDITGLSNTTVTGADFATKGRAATEEQLKAATGATTLKFVGDVATNTGSVNLKDDTFGIKGDGKYISTDVNGKNVNLTVSEAEVKKSAVAAVTVSTDTTDANNPLTVTPTTSADGTTKDYKVTIDGTKIANKTNLSYKANNGTAKQVSLADGLDFTNGTLTTASIDNKGVVKYDVNTAAITAGADGTITGPTTDGVATAKNVADAINAAKKASKTEITANTGEAANATKGNVTLTSTTAADGHIIYDVKLNDKVTLGSGANAVTIDGTAGKATIGSSVVDGVNNTFTTGGTNTVKLDGAAGTIKTGTVTVTGGTTNDITGLSNTTVNSADFATKGRAATEEQLKAVGEQTWQITADKDAATSGVQTGTKKDAKVGKDNKVQLIAGENLTVNQNERDFTYSLNKDLVKMKSATFLGTGTNTTVITGDSITQTAGTRTNTSTAGGNTVADGTKSTETTTAGQVIKDGAKTNTSTVDSNVIDDGNGNKNTSNATSNTITDGTNTSTITAGRATIGSSIVDGVNNTFTTGGTSPVTLNGATGTITGTTANIGGVTVNGTTNDITGLSNTTVTGADFATKGRAATEEQLKAVGEQTWQITADKDATTSGAQTGTKKDAKVGKDDKVQLIAGENLTVNQNERDFTYSLNKDLVKMNSATFEATGGKTTVIKGDSIVQTDGTKTNTATAGGNTVADGTKSTETTATGQVIKDGAKTNTSTVDENTIVDGTKSNKSTVDGNTITDGTNTTATTSSSVTVKDNAGNSTVITKDNITTGVGGNKITLDGTAGKATIGSSVVDGVNNTFTTGGTNTVKLDGAAGTIKTGTVTVTGGTTNDITGLSNTTVNSADFATKGRAATEEQLKAVGEQTWQITADKDAATSGVQTGTKKDAKVGKDNKVQLIAGENMTINQNERDFTFTLNKDLVKMNSATFLGTGSNTTVITGNTITQTAGTQTNTSTAGGNTVADGTKSTKTTAAGQVIKDGAKTNTSTVDENTIVDGVKSNKSTVDGNTITDGTNTSTVTAGKANIGNIAVDGVNNKITMGNGANSVTLDGANGHLDGLTNTTWVPGVTKATTGRAATEDQLQQVSDAVGAGWKVNTGAVTGSSGVSNGATSTKVSSGEEVKLQAGDNLVIDQNGKTVSYSLNKDLTKMNSATFEATGGKTTVIKGDSIVQTDGGKTNTSTAADNTIVDGNKSTATTAAGTTITDGTKTNTSTADKNVIDDGAGNKSTFTKDGITITKTGKDTVSLTSNGLDNGKNKIVNVAAGTADMDAVNVSQLKEYAAKSTTELTANNGEIAGNTKGNIVLTKTTAADGHTIYDNKLNDKITLGAADPTKAITVDGTAGTIKAGKDGNAVAINGTNGTVKAGDGTNAVAIDGVNGSVAVADKITLNGKDGKAGIGTVGIDGKDGIITTGGTNSVKVDGSTGTVTGLTNKTWTPGSIVSGRAATEDQLKSAVADSGWKATIGTDGSGQSHVVGTSPEKIKAEETVTFKAGNNMVVTQDGKSISYAVNPELTDMKSATFKDAAGNTTVTNGNGMTITPGSANPTNPNAGPVSLTKDGLNNGNNQIKGVAPGTDPTDAVNVGQLNASNASTSQAINQVAAEVQRVGAHAAAMAALKPIQYDPLEPTQVMAGVGNYRGETAAALGLAHYTNENTMFNVGVSVGGNHNMVNAGVTHKFGYSPEKKNIPDRYKAGPISSVYVMQDEVSSLKKENAEQKYVIADQAARLTTLEAENEQQRRELAETKKGLDDLKAAVDKLLASKG